MADFPYNTNPASLKRFLGHVQTSGVPDKVTIKYLEKVGFKSKNDRRTIATLKFLGFLDTGGVPTEVWQAYRNKTTAGATLAQAIRASYDDLFSTFPDAHRKDSEALRNYFSAHTRVAESTLGLIVATFKALADMADFEADAPPTPEFDRGREEKTRRKPAHTQRPSADLSGPAVNINIQLQLPATEDGEIYDKLFAALKKHLFS